MKIIKIKKNTEMYNKGCMAGVEWDDGSISYYKNKNIAKKAIEDDRN